MRAKVEDPSVDDANQPVRIDPDDLEAGTLRAVAESFVGREGTDYGERERSFDEKVENVLAQLERGEAVILFDPKSESLNLVPARELTFSDD